MSDRRRGRDVLPLLREDRSVRVAVLPALLVLCLVHHVTWLRPALIDDGLGGTAASLLTVVAVAVTVAAIGALVAFVGSTQLTQAVPLSSPLFTPSVVLPSALAVYSATSSALRLPRGAALALTLLAAAAAVRSISAHRRHEKRSRAYRLVSNQHPQLIEELIEEYRGALRDPALPGAERSALELLVASALADLAALVDRYDDLAEAERIIARELAAGGDARGLTGAAMSLAPALLARANWSEDVIGLEAGLDLVAQAAASVTDMLPVARRILLDHRSSGLLMLRIVSEAAGDEASARRLLGEALDALEHALRLTRRGTTDHADLLIEMASISWAHPDHGGLDAAIARCELGLRRLRLRRLRAREHGYLVLADLLLERAGRDHARRRADLDRAIECCELVARRGRRLPRALARLPVLLDAADADEAVVAGAFRRAFAALCTVSFDDAGGLAADWGAWAERRCYTTEAAEAHLCWIRTIAAESQRLRLRREVRRPRWDVQSLTADAGFWLLAAGRPRDAAITLERGCGVAPSERMHRGHGDLAKRLEARGLEDLGARWLEIGELMLPAQSPPRDARRGHRTGAGTVRVGGQSFRGVFSARDYAPLADYEQLVRAIGRVPGFDDVEAPPTYEDLRETAADGPLVYLATSPLDGGFAVIVTEESAEPLAVSLPGLTLAAVDACARALLDVGARDPADALEPALAWLWRYVLAPLVPCLPPAGLVTLVAVGELAVLPIHAAGMVRRADGAWRDRTGGLVFRYAPSARLLARAQAVAHALGDPPLPLVTIDGSSSTGPVLDALAEASIWHVACPVDHDPRDPLASCLRLADGRLALRAILAPGRDAPRLAVVSAARTAIGGGDIDELVGLAAALVQGGAGGVVCAPTVADPRGAIVLAHAFLERCAEGVDPPRALAEAQAWLASATNREVVAACGALHPVPVARPGIVRAEWECRREFCEPASWALFSYCGA